MSNDDNGLETREATAVRSASEARRRAVARREPTTGSSGKTIHRASSPRSADNVVYIDEWVRSMVEAGHAETYSPVAKASIERWLMRNPVPVPGDDTPF